MLIETGFQNIKFDYNNMGSIPKIPKITWQNISRGLLKGKRYSDNLIVSAQKMRLDEENIVR